MFIPTGIGLSA